jgi:two-component system response regulator PilR (NtrC family)
MGKPVKSIGQDAMRLLMNYDFPGNVRELENLVERAVALEVQSSISPESLPQKLLLPHSGALPPPAEAGTVPGQFDLEKGVEEFERRHILQALEAANGVKKKAAKLLGISFRSLRYRIEKYKIDDPNPEESE